MEKCIGCELCASVPTKCIYVRGADNDVETRPHQASALVSSAKSITYAASTAICVWKPARPKPYRIKTVRIFIHQSQRCHLHEIGLLSMTKAAQQLPWKIGAMAKIADLGWMRATSPAGDADFEGVVGWSDERLRTRQTATAGATFMELWCSSLPRRWCWQGQSALSRTTTRCTQHSVVLTLFGITVHFVSMEAHFLAAVQVIVYAGAIVVLFLFVIMLPG